MPRLQSRRAAARGLTRFELLLALGFLSVVGLVVTLFTSRASADTSRTKADEDAHHILSAAGAWQSQHPGVGCPTASQLIEDGNLENDARIDDPWGGKYRIKCEGGRLSVRSAGRDGRTNTGDDVAVESEAR